MRKNFELLGAVALAGVVAATGSAFTAGNTAADSVAGFGTSTISGATASSVAHTLSTDGTDIDSTWITFSTTQTGNTVLAGLGTAALESCVVDVVAGTTATCTYASGYDTATATAFDVAVSQHPPSGAAG